MKRKVSYLMMLCVLSVLGCTDRSYQGEEEEIIIETEYVPVLVNVGDDTFGIVTKDGTETKGSGAIGTDETDNWEEAEVYVYAFRKGSTESDFTVLSAEDEDLCLIDDSKDNPGSLRGKHARRHRKDSYLLWQGTEDLIYYPVGHSAPYNFYGYFLDDMEHPEVHREKNRIWMEAKIDGRQDLMTGWADTEYTEALLPEEGMTEKERNEIINSLYSSYSAQRNVHPSLIFRHQLTRLRFALLAGPRRYQDTILVESIKMGTKTDARITVAHEISDSIGITFPKQKYDTMSVDFSYLEDGKLPQIINYSYESGIKADTLVIPRSLLVAPDERYDAEITLMESRNDSTYTNPFVLRAPAGTFEPGGEYLITITVYGMMDIEVDISLKAWEEGGDFDYDFDKEWEESLKKEEEN